MNLKFITDKTTLTVKITGEIDHHISGKIRENIDLKLSTGIYNTLIFDLSELTFMDSSGIALILGRVKRIKTLNGNVKIIVNDIINRIIKISGITNYVDIERKDI